jgi:hypothetical protein
MLPVEKFKAVTRHEDAEKDSRCTGKSSVECGQRIKNDDPG